MVKWVCIFDERSVDIIYERVVITKQVPARNLRTHCNPSTNAADDALSSPLRHYTAAVMRILSGDLVQLTCPRRER